jgi:hypothetical protein
LEIPCIKEEVVVVVMVVVVVVTTTTTLKESVLGFADWPQENKRF